MKSFRILIIIIFTFTIGSMAAQETATQPELSLDKGPITNQFEFIYKKSGNYRSEGKKYEVVRTISLDKLRQNVLDSIKGFNQRIAGLNATISEHESTISSLNGKLEETTNNLVGVTEEKDSMSFLGILVSKATYNTILWSVIFGLLGLMLFFMYKFRRSNILTQEAKTSLSEVEEEYEDHRRRALEREQKISRQLQDEINKYKKSK
ncbi:tRNA (guanine-N1)-methyltransferase [Maribacter algarum]|uniref:tRNA (Guanine-N1)-methyltransferase n=1 Tax=Maribacter algarum (ex Zhang et al. 2020) TaxID=2578118 RepID=A0A5S3PHG2_9FLAO|nr:tRNA (guanine-N1)-methyltransferase [Maribacter algarum]TMM53632.1 tRNA (guanine-N1)-methyltransferase [Maribacter algarum]